MYNLYSVYSVPSVYSVCGVYDVCSECSVYNVYSVYSVCSVYSVSTVSKVYNVSSFGVPTLPKRGFWTRKSVETTRFTMFSRALIAETTRFTMFTRVPCVRKTALSIGNLGKTRPLRKKPCLFTCFSPAGRVKTRVLACQPFRNAGFGRASP